MGELETGIPIPPRGSRPGRPLSEMGAAILQLLEAPIGSSILFPVENTRKIAPSLWFHGGRGWFVTRTVEGGVRAWKIDEPKINS